MINPLLQSLQKQYGQIVNAIAKSSDTRGQNILESELKRVKYEITSVAITGKLGRINKI